MCSFLAFGRVWKGVATFAKQMNHIRVCNIGLHVYNPGQKGKTSYLDLCRPSFRAKRSDYKVLEMPNVKNLSNIFFITE